MKKLFALILAIATFIGGFYTGQHDAITNAELTHVTDTGYEITYHGATHYYDYE